MSKKKWFVIWCLVLERDSGDAFVVVIDGTHPKNRFMSNLLRV